MSPQLRVSPSVKKLTVVAALALLAAPSLAESQQGTPPAEPFPAELDGYIAKVLADWRIPGIAIAVVRNDSVLVAKGYGVRELGKPARVDANTVFDVASIGKSFTAMAAAMLVDRGKLRWDDPVRRWLPDLVLRTDSLTAQATLRDFLSHRTGLDAANMMWVPTSVTRAEVLQRMRHLRSVASFRQQMVYSNIGYSVAGEAIAAAAGVPYESMMRDMVINPLRLSSTTWTYEQILTMPNVAVSHATIAGRQQPIAWEQQRQAIAPAVTQSSANDMARWMRLHLNGGVLDGVRYVSDSSMREMHGIHARIPTTPAMRAARLVQDTVIGYGLGWQIFDYRGHRAWWHTGNGDGQIAWMTLFPNDRLGVVVMVNTWSAPNIHGALINRIADTYLGFPPRDWAAEAFARLPAQDSARAAAARLMSAMKASASTPRLPLAAYAGRYDHPLFGPVWIRLAAPGLTLQMGGGQLADLEHHGADAFFTVWRDPLFRELYGTHVSFAAVGDSVVSFTTQLNRDQFTARKAGAPAAPASAR